MALASLDGKLEEYLKLVNEGMNTIQLDVKEERQIDLIPLAVRSRAPSALPWPNLAPAL